MEICFYNNNYTKQWKDFLKKYDPRRNASFYKWKYMRQCGDIQSSLMLLKEKDKIVSCLSSLGDKAWIHNKTATIRTLVDLYVDPEFRKGYGAYLLLRYISEFSDDILLACGPTPIAALMYEKLGWKKTVLKTYYFPINIKYWKNKIIPARILKALGFIVNPAVHSYIRLYKRIYQKDKTYRIYKDIDSFFNNEKICQLCITVNQGLKVSIIQRFI